MARWAVFDVDGTLLPHRSMERFFLPFAVRTGVIPLRNVARYLASCAASGRGVDAFRSDKTFLVGLSVSAVEDCARSVFRARIAPSLSARGLQAIAHCRERGYAIMIITGAPDFLARLVAHHCGGCHVVGTAMEVRDGRYTGQIRGIHPYGERKRELLLGLRDTQEIDFSASVVFANHQSDVAHMELFGEPVAVNPTVRLRAVTRRRGWRVERWT